MLLSDQIDRSECPLVEVKPNVQGGAPVLRGTRLPVSAIVDNFDYGLSPEDISEQFQVPLVRVNEILEYVAGLQLAHPVR
jgi:uncharacterized protein (DUF433 family)